VAGALLWTYSYGWLSVTACDTVETAIEEAERGSDAGEHAVYAIEEETPDGNHLINEEHPAWVAYQAAERERQRAETERIAAHLARQVGSVEVSAPTGVGATPALEWVSVAAPTSQADLDDAVAVWTERVGADRVRVVPT